MALTVGLLVLLALPTVIWAALRWRPKGGPDADVPKSGPKHRWWQP